MSESPFVAGSPSAQVPTNGCRTGRRAVKHGRELLDRIAATRAASMTLQAIAARLNNEGGADAARR
jgi:hypothetical protein